MSNKPISFKPTPTDQLLIDALKVGGLTTNADVLRAAIQQLALVRLEQDRYLNLIADGYESEVMPS